MSTILHQQPPSILIRSQSASSLPNYVPTHSDFYHSSDASSSPHRRIHFAPLPDPRRSIDSSGLTPPDSDSETISNSGTPLVASSPRDSSDSPPGSCFSPDSEGPSSLLSHPNLCSPQETSLNDSTTSLPQPSRSPPTSWSRPNRLFKPFLKRGSSPAPGGLGISAEELLTLGAINLFRTSSKESQASRRSQSADDGGSSQGWGLSRWASAGSNDSKATAKSGTDRFSSSFPRAHSTPTLKDAGKSKSKAKQTSVSALLSTSPPSSSSIMPAHTVTPPPTLNSPASGLATLSNIRVRKGTRMLNGRVYGARRPPSNANPFANARDEEPEFVEWGYGGMGSVKNGAGTGSAMWSPLQSQGGVMVGSVEGKEGTSAPEEDDDDGSGMGWVKKRREKREKERLAIEEAEKMAAQSKEREQPSSSSTTPQDPESHAHAPSSASPPTDTNPGAVPQPQKDAGPEPGSNPISAATPPALIPASGSFERHEILTASVPSHLHRRTSSGRRISDQGPVGALAGPSSASGSGSSSAPSSNTESLDEEDEESGESTPVGGSDDEDDDVDEVALRMTSRCAAVEKISRHKDDRQSF